MNLPAPVRRLIAWILQLRVVRAVLTYSEHRGPMLADAITYRSLFGIFAAVLLGFSGAALWLEDRPDTMTALASTLEQVIPGLSAVIDPSAIEAPTRWTVLGIASLLGIGWAAVSAIGSLRTALLDLGDELHDSKGAFWGALRDLLFAIGFALLIVTATGLSALGSKGIAWLADIAGFSALSTPVVVGTQLVSVLIVFTVDVCAVALMFRLLADYAAPANALWRGAALGAVGLTVLQTLSGLFVRGATSNPLLASFAVLIALLLWVNLSVQVVLIASSYIIVASREQRANGTASDASVATFAERRQYRAQTLFQAASQELVAANEAVKRENSPS